MTRLQKALDKLRPILAHWRHLGTNPSPASMIELAIDYISSLEDSRDAANLQIRTLHTAIEEQKKSQSSLETMLKDVLKAHRYQHAVPQISLECNEAGYWTACVFVRRKTPIPPQWTQLPRQWDGFGLRAVVDPVAGWAGEEDPPMLLKQETIYGELAPALKRLVNGGT